MKKPATIDEYLEDVPEVKRAALGRLRSILKAAVPELEEGIGWGMPILKYKGKNLVGFAAFKEHCSFFPMSAKVMEEYADDLERYETSKGTIHFKPDKPLPVALVKKLVKARVRESQPSISG